MSEPTNITAFEIIREGKAVAQGCLFQSGKCVVSWLGKHRSVAVYDDMDDVLAVHGHEGTQFVSIIRIDGKKANRLLTNRYQDECENIHVEFRAGSNAEYVWGQRDTALQMFERKDIERARGKGDT